MMPKAFLILLSLFCSLTWSTTPDNQVLYPDSGWSLDHSRSLTQEELKQGHLFGNYDTYSHWVPPFSDTWCFGGKQGADIKTQVFMQPGRSQTFVHDGANIDLDQIYLKSVNCFYLNSGDSLFIISRSHSKGQSEVPISVRTSRLTKDYSHHMFNSLMIYFGLILGFIIVHMMFGFFSKFQPSYWYAIFLGCYGLTSMMYANMESMIFESNSPFIQSDTPLLITMTTWAITGFTFNYFRSNHLSKLIQACLLILPITSFMVNFISRFFPEIISYNLMLESFVIQLFIIIILAATASLKKKSFSGVFLIGWSVFMLGFIVFTLNETFPSGNTMVAMYSTTVAHVFEMILFTIFFGFQALQQQRAASKSLEDSQQLAENILKKSADTLPGQLEVIRNVDSNWDPESKKIWEISAHRLELSLKQIRTVVGLPEPEHGFTMKAWIHELSLNFYNAYLAQRSGSRFKIISHLTEEPEEIPHRLNLSTQIALDNAFKFSNNKEVILEIQQSDHNLVISVHDDGPGFPDEILQNYHTAFWQESTGLTRKHQGLGLGFKVISELLSPITAKWELEYSPLLGGALFSIYYPVAWKSNEQEPFERNLVYTPNTTYQELKPKSNQEIFLIVDDNSINIKIVGKMIQKAGYDYHKAENGQVALTLYEENPNYFAIFMDLQMPVMDGFEATKQIREFEKRVDIPETPIIALTAHSGPETLMECQQVGMLDMIPKPIKFAQVSSVIELIKNQKHATAHKLSQMKDEDSEKFNLLVVDDNLINRKVLCRMANKLGFETVQAENGQEAFDFFTGNYKFKAVLMDLQMPIVDGFEATKMIRLWEHTSSQVNIPIIAVTAHSGPETLSQCIKCGMQDMISKPFKVDALLGVFEKHQIPMPKRNQEVE